MISSSFWRVHMCVCICICVYIYVCVIYVPMCIYVDICDVHTFRCICMSVLRYRCIYVLIWIHMGIGKGEHIYGYIYTCLGMDRYTHSLVYVHMSSLGYQG